MSAARGDIDVVEEMEVVDMESTVSDNSYTLSFVPRIIRFS
jgi:hypothetical protein